MLRRYGVEVYGLLSAALFLGCLVGTVTAIREMRQASAMMLVTLLLAVGFGIMAIAAADVRQRCLANRTTT